MSGAWILLLCGHLALPGAAGFALLTAIMAVAFAVTRMVKSARRDARVALTLEHDVHSELVSVASLNSRLRGLEAELHALDDHFATETAAVTRSVSTRLAGAA